MADQEARSEDELGDEQPFISHLLELRDRLLRMVLCVVVIFVGLVYWSNTLYEWLSRPLLKMLPQGGQMIATDVASPFLTPFKLTLMVSIFVSIPYILYQFWGFVAPGLYKNERRMIVPILVSSVALFYTGMAFAYYVVFPIVFKFFAATAPTGVSFSPDIAKYLSFVMTIFFAFGAAFEVPIVTIVLVWMGVTTPKKLRRMRPYIIVGAFAVGAVLTPPDALSQSMLAFPMWLLFELGLVFSRFYMPKDADEDEDEDDADEGEPEGPDDGPRGGGAAVAPESSGDTQGDEPGFASDAEMESEFDRIDREMSQLAGEQPADDQTGEQHQDDASGGVDSQRDPGDKKPD